MRKSLYSLLMMGGILGGNMHQMMDTEPQVRKPKKKEPTEPQIAFHKQEAIAKMIKDYQDIKLGNSKKGTAKQARIVSKIDGYIKSGLLTLEQLKPEPDEQHK